MDPSLRLTTSGVKMATPSPALQPARSTPLTRPHSAVTPHSGPASLALSTTRIKSCCLTANVALPTNNTATIPGTPRQQRTLNTKMFPPICQLVKTTLIEHST